jgi:hypothetical protein
LRVSALILGVSIVILSLIGSYTIFQIKAFERVVTVKGLAEKEVKSDVAIFPISFAISGNNLRSLLAEAKTKSMVVQDFFIDEGFSKDEISISLPSINDNQQYNSKALYKYSVSTTLNIYTRKVDLVLKTRKKLDVLSDSDIFVSEGWIQFLFEGLNEIKPEMIEKATKNAREVAEKFASDSGSHIGKIKTASQGQFSIYDRDSNSPHLKKVRVVSTIQYYLKD